MSAEEKWYYAAEENTVGPFTAARLRAFRAAHIISDETLVCAADSPQWRPFEEQFGAAPSPAPVKAHGDGAKAPKAAAAILRDFLLVGGFLLLILPLFKQLPTSGWLLAPWPLLGAIFAGQRARAAKRRQPSGSPGEKSGDLALACRCLLFLISLCAFALASRQMLGFQVRSRSGGGTQAQPRSERAGAGDAPSNTAAAAEGKEAQTPRLPGRAAFEDALSKTRAALGDEGVILVQDADGAKLIVRIQMSKDEAGIPQRYDLEARYDGIAIEPSNEWIDPAKEVPLGEAPWGIALVREGKVHLGEPADAALSQAIEKLVDWSIAAVETGTQTLTRSVFDDEKAGSYEFRCDQEKGQFYLLMKRRMQLDLMTLQRTRVIGYDYPVTDYRRAHLWKHFFDHRGEIKQLADAYFSGQQAAAKRANAAAKMEEERRAALDQQQEQERQQAQRAEERRLDEVFARPSSKPAAGKQTGREAEPSDPVKASSAAPPPGHRAKPGVYYLLQYVSIKTAGGIQGFEPGHEVRLVRELKEKGTMAVTADGFPMEVSAAWLTNDLDAAAQASRRDQAQQAQIAAEIAAQNNTRNAAQQRQLYIDHARDVEAVERQRVESSRVGGKSNPLGIR